MKNIGIKSRIGLRRSKAKAGSSVPVVADYRIVRTTLDRRIVRGTLDLRKVR